MKQKKHLLFTLALMAVLALSICASAEESIETPEDGTDVPQTEDSAFLSGGPDETENTGGPGETENTGGPDETENAGGPGEAENTGGSDETENTAGPGEAENTVGPGEAENAPDTYEEEVIELDGPPENSGVFQNGSLEGPQTVPGEPMSIAADWEEDAYRLILDAWQQQKTICDVSSLRISRELHLDDFRTLLSEVINDHPELFYADRYGTIRSSSGVIQTVTLSYRNFPNGINQAIRNFNAAADSALSQLQGVESEAEKALLLHDWLVLRCDYNRPASQALWQGTWEEFCKTTDNIHMWSAYGALVNGDPVCQGYALAYKYLLSLAGIDSIYLSSRAMNHAWNAVRIDGEWYHVDITWDDPTPGTEGRCVYSYFLLSDDTIKDETHRHHGWDASLVTCGSTRFEEGWAFNGLRLPLYRRNGSYYYICPVEETYQINGSFSRTADMNAVFKTTALDDPGQRLPGSLGWAGGGGAVWLENRLYLIPYVPNYQTAGSTSERLLLAYDLDSGVIAQAGRFTYTPTVSSNGQYSEGLDRQLGLRYNSRTHEIEAVSPNHRTVAASFPARSLSASWANTAESAPGAAPGLSPDGTAAALYGPDFQGGGELWAAFYREGRFVALRRASIGERIDGSLFLISPALSLVYLDTKGLPSYDSLRLMPLTEDLCPAGAAA